MDNTNESTPNAAPVSPQPQMQQQEGRSQTTPTPPQAETHSTTSQSSVSQTQTSPTRPNEVMAQPQAGTNQHINSGQHPGTYGQSESPLPPPVPSAFNQQVPPVQYYQQPYHSPSQPPYGHATQTQVQQPYAQARPQQQHYYTQAQPQQPPQAHAQTSAHQSAPGANNPSAKADKKPAGAGKNFLVSFLGGALAVILGLSGFGIYNAVTGSSANSSGGTTVLGSAGSTIDIDDTNETLAQAVADKVLPSIVNIDVYVASSGYNPFGFGGGSEGELTELSLGSGVILSEDGYIITNYHVIENSDVLEVTIGDDAYEAEVVGTDPSSDLAVIKAVDASGLTPVEIGDSANLHVGEWVMSAGSPFGLEQSVATGIVSATSRSQIMESSTGGEVTMYTNLIQTDAAINPGNSGGALVDSDGKLVGINTLITSYSGNYSGVGFAIPVDYALSIAEQIIDGKTPTHAQLGVSLSSITPSTAQRYGLSADYGAYVGQIFAGGAAEKAGIKVGDIISKFNDAKIESATDLMLAIRSLSPGDKAKVEYNREGKTISTEVVLGSDAETSQSSMKNTFDNGSPLQDAA